MVLPRVSNSVSLCAVLLNFCHILLFYFSILSHIPVFWGGREGYQSLLNTDVRRELDHMATFFKMAVGKCGGSLASLCCLRFVSLHEWMYYPLAYKKKIGFTGQLLIEPKPKEPTKHQYDYGQCLSWKRTRSHSTLAFTIVHTSADAQTVISFLKIYDLDGDFKVCVFQTDIHFDLWVFFM